MSKSRVLATVLVLICASQVLGGQMRRLLRTGGPPAAPPPSVGDWPNEPGGQTVLSDWDMADTVTTLGIGTDDAVGSTGWRAVFNHTVGSGVGWAENESDITALKSPSTIIDFTYPMGMSEGSAPATFYRNYGGGKKRTYLGWYWKVSNPFDYGPNGVKVMFIFDTTGNSPQYLILKPDGKVHVATRYAAGTGSTINYAPNINSTFVSLNTWHLVEWYMDIDTTTLKWWLDGDLQGSYTGVEVPPQWGEVHISPTFGGNTGATKTQTDHYWYDHIHLSVS